MKTGQLAGGVKNHSRARNGVGILILKITGIENPAVTGLATKAFYRCGDGIGVVTKGLEAGHCAVVYIHGTSLLNPCTDFLYRCP